MISIIIPCFNCAGFVARAIESVINQTFSDWELLLINNNSTDETGAILLKYQTQHPDKVRILFENKKGAPLARNRGLWESKGEWIQFLDADDEIVPDKLEHQYQLAITMNPPFIASTYQMLGKDHFKTINEIRHVDKDDVWSAIITSNLGITSANLWNRQMLYAVNGWDETLIASQEYDLMFRILQISTDVVFDDRNTAIVHIVPGESVSRGSGTEKRARILESKWNLRLKIKAYLKANHQLTPKRLKLVDNFIYTCLVKSYRFQPNMVKETLCRLNLKVEISSKIKGFYFMRKMDAKKLLKRGEN
jgi:glycosyltransferase involved in cell wall biosynthesis